MATYVLPNGIVERMLDWLGERTSPGNSLVICFVTGFVWQAITILCLTGTSETSFYCAGVGGFIMGLWLCYARMVRYKSHLDYLDWRVAQCMDDYMVDQFYSMYGNGDEKSGE